MNKKLFAIIAAATLLTACDQNGAVLRSSDSTYDNPMVTLISEEPYGYFIAYDKDTMVMYIGKHNGEGGRALCVNNQHMKMTERSCFLDAINLVSLRSIICMGKGQVKTTYEKKINV